MKLIDYFVYTKESKEKPTEKPTWNNVYFAEWFPMKVRDIIILMIIMMGVGIFLKLY